MDDDSVVSPSDAESTVVWSNVVTQCDSTLQLNIPVTIKNKLHVGEVLMIETFATAASAMVNYTKINYNHLGRIMRKLLHNTTLL